MSNLDVNSEITTGQRLFEMYGDIHDEVVNEAAERSEITRLLAKAYDASNYAWRSDGHVGNTLNEINEIRAYGHPLPKSRTGISGEMHFRGFQYEGTDGFLKGSNPIKKKETTDVEDYEPLELLYLEPLDTQEQTLRASGFSEIVHNQYGRGFLLASTGELAKVYFMQLPGSTPSCHHGANVRWVKTSNLL